MNTKVSLARILAVVLTATTAVGLLGGCQALRSDADGGTGQPGISQEPAPTSTTIAGDYVTIVGSAERPYKPHQVGVVEYCPLDELDRAVCAFGELTRELRDQAQARGRQDIDVDPSGWANNDETTIPALDEVKGSADYHGWFWNRSHLVADSLGGDAVIENLVTGTRTQNVGSTQNAGQYAGGMAYTELLARTYLDSVAAENCPLYYAATARYRDTELIPRVVVVDVKSCDGSIDQRARVTNAANGFDIDYRTGQWAPSS